MLSLIFSKSSASTFGIKLKVLYEQSSLNTLILFFLTTSVHQVTLLIHVFCPLKVRFVTALHPCLKYSQYPIPLISFFIFQFSLDRNPVFVWTPLTGSMSLDKLISPCALVSFSVKMGIINNPDLELLWGLNELICETCLKH